MTNERLEVLIKQLQDTGEVEFEYDRLQYQVVLVEDNMYSIDCFVDNVWVKDTTFEGSASTAILYAISTPTLNNKEWKLFEENVKTHTQPTQELKDLMSLKGFDNVEYEQDPITEMMRFQSDRQLHLMGYNNLNETSLVLEEIFESFGFNVPKENREQLTNSFKSWMTTCDTNGTIVYDSTKVNGDGNVKWEESVDSTCDQIVFLIGKLMKLKVDPKLALLETAKEINSRKGKLIDGKFTKFREGEEGHEPTYTADYSKCKVSYD